MKELAIHIDRISKAYQLGEFSSKTFADEVKKLFIKKTETIDLNDRANTQTKGKVYALKNINIDIKKGEVVGIIGKNGAGKSTLLKLLSRVTSPTEGDIYINGRIGALLEVGTGFQPDLTGRENIFLNGAILGMTKAEINAKLPEIISFSGCAKYLDTPVKRYSSGMTVRLGFAVAAHLEPEILVIDEVLAVGDQEFQDQCIKKMKDYAGAGKTVLFVSHNMASVKALCQRGIVLDKGSVTFDGSIDAAIQHYLTRQEKSDDNGLIRAGSGAINTNEAFLDKIILKGDSAGNRNLMLYGENIFIDTVITSLEKIDVVNVEFIINSADNYVIGNTNNVFDKQTISLQKGLNKLQCTMENNLLPGNYSLTVAIAKPSGDCYHYLENIIDFKIDSIPLDKNNPYPFVWINGLVKFKSKWQIN